MSFWGVDHSPILLSLPLVQPHWTLQFHLHLFFFSILFFSSDFFVPSLPLIDSLFLIYSFEAGIVCCEPDTTPGLGVRRMKKIIMVPHRSVKYNTAQSLILFLSNCALGPAVPHILVTSMAPVHIWSFLSFRLQFQLVSCVSCIRCRCPTCTCLKPNSFIWSMLSTHQTLVIQRSLF